MRSARRSPALHWSAGLFVFPPEEHWSEQLWSFMDLQCFTHSLFLQEITLPFARNTENEKQKKMLSTRSLSYRFSDSGTLSRNCLLSWAPCHVPSSSWCVLTHFYNTTIHLFVRRRVFPKNSNFHSYVNSGSSTELPSSQSAGGCTQGLNLPSED